MSRRWPPSTRFGRCIKESRRGMPLIFAHLRKQVMIPCYKLVSHKCGFCPYRHANDAAQTNGKTTKNHIDDDLLPVESVVRILESESRHCLCFLHFLEYRWSNSELVFWFYWCSRGKWEKCQKQCFHYYHHLTQIQKKMSGKVFFANAVSQAPCWGPAIHWIKTRIKCFNFRSETQNINMQEKQYLSLYILLLVLSDRPWSQNHL